MFPDWVWKDLSEVVLVNKLNLFIKFKRKIELCQDRNFLMIALFVQNIHILNVTNMAQDLMFCYDRIVISVDFYR